MTEWTAPESGWYMVGSDDPPRKVNPECGACGAELQDFAGHLLHAEPWCPSWTYHTVIGDERPVKWPGDARR